MTEIRNINGDKVLVIDDDVKNNILFSNIFNVKKEYLPNLSDDELKELYRQVSLLIYDLHRVESIHNAIFNLVAPYNDACINNCKEIAKDKVCEPFTEKQCEFIAKYILDATGKRLYDSALYPMMEYIVNELYKRGIYTGGIMAVPSDEVSDMEKGKISLKDLNYCIGWVR